MAHSVHDYESIFDMALIEEQSAHGSVSHELQQERKHKRPYNGKQDDAVFVSLTPSYHDLVRVKIDVPYSQSGALRQAEARSIEKPAAECANYAPA